MKTDLIKLSKNDWHYKLIRYTWGINPEEFKNLCPYFWLAVASIFCCPIITLKKLFNRVSKFFFLKSLSKEQIYYILESDQNLRKIGYFSKAKRKAKKYFNTKEDFLKDLGVSREETTGYENSFKTKLNQELTKKEELYKIINRAKIITKLFWIICLGFLGFILTWIFSGLICWGIYTGEGFFVILSLLIIWTIIATPFLLFWMSWKYENDWKTRFGSLSWYVYLGLIPFLIIYLPLKKIILGALDIIGIFGKYLKASYKDYCPGINWEE